MTENARNVQPELVETEGFDRVRRAVHVQRLNLLRNRVTATRAASLSDCLQIALRVSFTDFSDDSRPREYSKSFSHIEIDHRSKA